MREVAAAVRKAVSQTRYRLAQYYPISRNYRKADLRSIMKWLSNTELAQGTMVGGYISREVHH